MIHRIVKCRELFLLLMLGSLISFCATGQTAAQDVSLMGIGELPGDFKDASGLNEILPDGTPHNQFGGISAIDRVGNSNEYLALSDRGPKDGAVPWSCRFHRLRVDLGAQGEVRVELIETILLRDERGVPLTGSATAIGLNGEPRRFDPEGIRWLDHNRILISDEYGPYVWEFDLQGKFQGSLCVAGHFGVEKLAPGNEESKLNIRGRQANRGMEGLAYCSQTRMAWGAMQSPLIQDAQRDESGSLRGLDCRLVGFNRASGELRECVYRLDATSNKLSEILADGDDRFLLIERDGLSGASIGYQRVIAIDLLGASDVSEIESLLDYPGELVPVRKRTVIDLLDPRFGLAGESMPEKIEGLCWGPVLADGRRTLLIAVDNDFVGTAKSHFYVFSLRQ